MFKKLFSNLKIVSTISLSLILINSWSMESEKSSLKNLSQAIGNFLFDAKIYLSEDAKTEIRKYKERLQKIELAKNDVKNAKTKSEQQSKQNKLTFLQNDLANDKRQDSEFYKNLDLALKIKPENITSVNFELYNKSNQPIAFALYGKDKNGKNKIFNTDSTVNIIFPLGTKTKTGKQDTVQFENVDLNNQSLILAIWYPKPDQLLVEGKLPSIFGKIAKKVTGSNNYFDPQPTFKYKFTNKFYNDLRQGKVRTAYLTFDAAGFGIRPQTGKLKGYSGTTETGLSTVFNIPVDNFKDYIVAYEKSL